MIETAIQREAGHDLSMDEVVETFDQIMCGRCAEDDIARWLLALNRKGASVSEVAGAAMALRRKMTPIRSSRTELLDTCGTGGDQLHYLQYQHGRGPGDGRRRRGRWPSMAIGRPAAAAGRPTCWSCWA